MTERIVRHRLTPDRALVDLEDAAGFVAEMGVVLQAPDPLLPSLFAAAQGAPARPGTGGFGDWPAHAWWWAGALGERPDILSCKVLLGKRTLVHRSCWPALDAAVRDREAIEPAEAALVDALRRLGEVSAEALRDAVGLGGPAGKARFQRTLLALERRGRVIGRAALVDGHHHVSLVCLWEQRFPERLDETLPRTVDAFLARVLAAAGPFPEGGPPERDVVRWFGWPGEESAAALGRLSGGVPRPLP
jgi:hypothetical protein